MEILGYRLTILRPRGQVDKPYGGQIVSSPVPCSIMLHGGGGVATERGGGVLRSEHQAGYRRSTIPNHSIYQLGFPNNYFGLDIWITPERAYPAIQFEWISCMKQEEGGGVDQFMGKSVGYITVLKWVSKDPHPLKVPSHQFRSAWKRYGWIVYGPRIVNRFLNVVSIF